MIVASGDRVRFWTNQTGLKPLFGIVEEAELRYGSTYAAIKPDGSDNLVYLFYGAIWGFALIDEYIHPWSPQAMGRLKSRGAAQQNSRISRGNEVARDIELGG